jgi:outer membrane protein assembly factor BamB
VDRQLFRLLIALGIFVAGCKEVAPPKAVVVGPVPANSFARSWVQDLELKGGDKVWQLHLTGGSLFVYTLKHEAYQLSRDGGSLMTLAAVTTAGTTLAPPVVVGDEVVYPTNTSLEIYGKDGKKERSIDLDFAMSSPAISDGHAMYVGGNFPGSPRFVAIDPSVETGWLKWSFVTQGSVTAAPAMYQNTLFLATEGNRVYAVNDKMEPLWPMEGFSFQTAGRVLADVKADDFGVYVASTDSKLYCLDRATGRIKWQYYAQRPLEDSPIVLGTNVYQAVPGVGLVVLDKATGLYNRQAKWIAHGVVQILSEDGQNVYARLQDNRIAALDKQTGERKFTSQRRDLTLFVTNTADATIFASTADGHVYAITPVLKPGTISEIVLNERPVETLARAN